MIERLQRVLSRIEQLPIADQEEAAEQLEVLTELFEETRGAETNAPDSQRSFAGI